MNLFINNGNLIRKLEFYIRLYLILHINHQIFINDLLKYYK